MLVKINFIDGSSEMVKARYSDFYHGHYRYDSENKMFCVFSPIMKQTEFMYPREAVKSIEEVRDETDQSTAEDVFRVLIGKLHMDFVLDEDTNYIVKDRYGANVVYRSDIPNIKFDDRGDLFVALRNVAVNMFPNLSFRSEDYIYSNKD